MSSTAHNLAVIRQLRSKYSDCIPAGSFGLLDTSNEKAVADYASRLYEAVCVNFDRKYKKPERKSVHYMSNWTPRGEFRFTDMESGRQLSIVYKDGGLFDYHGSETIIEDLGGRGKLAGIIPLMYDMQPFQDARQYRKAA